MTTSNVPDPLETLALVSPALPGRSPASRRAELARVRARERRLAPVWRMSAMERVAAMRRGELTLEQLAEWTARLPHEVPAPGGEPEWVSTIPAPPATTLAPPTCRRTAARIPDCGCERCDDALGAVLDDVVAIRPDPAALTPELQVGLLVGDVLGTAARGVTAASRRRRPNDDEDCAEPGW